MKPDQQHFSIWFLASGPCGSIKMTYHDFTAANKHNMMILNTHSSSQGSWATTYLRYRRNKFIFWRSILRGSVTWVLRACSLFLVMCTSSTSVVNGKNCIQEWTPKDTYRNEIGKRALEYKYAMESIWFNTIGRSSSVSSILTRLFISLGMSSLRSSVYSIMLKHHTLLEVVWFHRVHPTETSFSLFGP